jgi:hypothetical protein
MGEYSVRSSLKTPSVVSYSYLLTEFFGISTIILTASGAFGPGSISDSTKCESGLLIMPFDLRPLLSIAADQSPAYGALAGKQKLGTRSIRYIESGHCVPRTSLASGTSGSQPTGSDVEREKNQISYYRLTASNTVGDDVGQATCCGCCIGARHKEVLPNCLVTGSWARNC